MDGDETKWSLSALKPGDEVGVQVGSSLGVDRVVAIHEDGVIEIEGDDYYGPDGRNLFTGSVTNMVVRLVEPTDEGRIASLIENIRTDLDILGDKAREMTLEQLREFREAILELSARS